MKIIFHKDVFWPNFSFLIFWRGHLLPPGSNKNVKIFFHKDNFHKKIIWNFKITREYSRLSLTLSISLVFHKSSLVSPTLFISLISSLSCSLHLRPHLSPTHSPSQTTSLSRSLSISGRSIVTITDKFQNLNPIIAGTNLGFIIFILSLFNWTCLLGRRINCLGRRWPRGCRKAGSIPNPRWSYRIIYAGPCVTGSTFGFHKWHCIGVEGEVGLSWPIVDRLSQWLVLTTIVSSVAILNTPIYDLLKSNPGLGVFFLLLFFFHYKFERYASNMIGIFDCATAGFFFFLSRICFFQWSAPFTR